MRVSFVILFVMLYLGLVAQNIEKDKHTTGPPNGSLVVVGGSLSDASIYDRFLELAGGPGAQIVLIITAASDYTLEIEDYIPGVLERFSANNIKNITLLHTRDRAEANKPEFSKPIREADGVWFLGGRQWRLADSYLNTLVHEELWKLLDRGGVIGGSSAGATIMGSYLVRGDTKSNLVMMGDHEEGLGFIKNMAIDQHVLALNRQFDLKEIMEAHPHMLGIGLDENTAIVVKGNTFEVIGRSYVTIWDGSSCQFVHDSKDWSHEKIIHEELPEGTQSFYLLGKGRKYDMKTRKVIE